MEGSFGKREDSLEQRTDALLDELNIHLREAQRIKDLLTDAVLSKGDSELREEQHVYQPIINTDPNNPLLKQLHQEETAITQIKLKIAGQNQ